MAPEGRRSRLACVCALAATLASFAPPAHALRIVDWNLLNYPGTTGSTRDPKYRTVLSPLNADVIVAEEMTSQAGVTEFLNSLNTMNPGAWAAAPFVDGNDTDAAIFWRIDKFQFIRQFAFYPNPANNLRYVHDFVMRPVGYTTEASDIRFYAVHLKASTGSTNVTQRGAEAAGLRDSMNAMAPNSHAFALGDFNVYNLMSAGGVEPAIQRLVESQANDIGRCYDPLGIDQLVPWQDNSSIAIHHTQSPCKTQGDPNCGPGASSGGLDDRFDLIYPTLNWNDGQGYELVPGSMVSIGNDGLHLNAQLIDSPTIPEGSAYAAALQSVSDHLPQRLDIQVQALASLTNAIDFGTMIVGATTNLTVSNVAVPPADGLSYSVAPPVGFSMPTGPFEVAPGTFTNHVIALVDAAPYGPRSGYLTMTSDDPNQPVRQVSLTANALSHAVASLDSATDVTAGTLDFGSQQSGGFTPQLVAVHDFGYGATQARLSLQTAVITGGDGRFSIGGFAPTLVADVGARYDVSFDDTGATGDSTYTATLTFGSADESLPGAQPQPDLTVALSAHPASGATGVPGLGGLPGVTRLFAPFPNPFEGQSRVRLDLARAADVRLEVVDLSGRRVATLERGTLEPGRYAFTWSGRDDRGGAARAGIYFVRLSGRGVPVQSTRLAVVR